MKQPLFIRGHSILMNLPEEERFWWRNQRGPNDLPHQGSWFSWGRKNLKASLNERMPLSVGLQTCKSSKTEDSLTCEMALDKEGILARSESGISHSLSGWKLWIEEESFILMLWGSWSESAMGESKHQLSFQKLISEPDPMSQLVLSFKAARNFLMVTIAFEWYMFKSQSVR